MTSSFSPEFVLTIDFPGPFTSLHNVTETLIGGPTLDWAPSVQLGADGTSLDTQSRLSSVRGHPLALAESPSVSSGVRLPLAVRS